MYDEVLEASPSEIPDLSALEMDDLFILFEDCFEKVFPLKEQSVDKCHGWDISESNLVCKKRKLVWPSDLSIAESELTLDVMDWGGGGCFCRHYHGEYPWA